MNGKNLRATIVFHATFWKLALSHPRFCVNLSRCLFVNVYIRLFKMIFLIKYNFQIHQR